MGVNTMGYKNVCTNCRISLSEGTNYELFNTNKTCPICKSKMYFVNEKFKAVNVNIRMYNFDDVQCTVIPSVAYGFVTGMNLQLC